MAETLDLSVFVKRQDDGMAHLDLAIEGIDCAACIDEIEGGLCRLDGSVDARTTPRIALRYSGRREPSRPLPLSMNCSALAIAPILISRVWSKRKKRAAPSGF